MTPLRKAKDLPRLDRGRGIGAASSVSSGRTHWAVVLAGGDGTRLQSLTCKISGDLKPKQFCSAGTLADNDLDSAYRKVGSVDFSHAVLVPQPHRLLVVRDELSGWTDLGNPNRGIDTLTRNNIEQPWLSELRSQTEIVKS